jgi:hypothetical protein
VIRRWLRFWADYHLEKVKQEMEKHGYCGCTDAQPCPYWIDLSIAHLSAITRRASL